MKRREFIALVGGAVAAWPLAALAAQGKTAKIGVLVFGYPDPSIFVMGLKTACAILDMRRGEASSLSFALLAAGQEHCPH
jgi:hypothetical protein